MRRLLALAALCLAPLPGLAECVGNDLVAALPSAEREALRARADAVPFARGNLWRASRDGEEVVLVGTYHLDDPRHGATMALLAPELDKAATLLVEAGPEEEAALKHRLAKEPEMMIQTSGPTLPETLPPEQWQALSEALQARGIPAFMGAKLKPWYLTMMLSVPVCALEAATQGSRGLDGMLIEAATARGLPVRALEPYDTVLRLFGDMPRDEQIEMVTSTLAMEAQSEDMGATLAAGYFAGESRLIWEFMQVQNLQLPGQTPEKVAKEFAQMDEAMIASRNRGWVPLIEAEAARGPVLVAFGALHLSGEQGVLNLLAQRGFTIRPLDAP